MFVSSNCYAQHNEIGAFLGGAYYLGDINPGKQFYNSKPTLGLILRHNFNPRVSIRLNAFDGTVAASDAQTKVNVIRNLSFRSNVAELSTQIEINFLPYLPGKSGYTFTPYVFGGFAVFKFNPQANYEGQWYDLQPMQTEGENTPYHRISMAIPFGFGFKFNIAKSVSLNLEWGLRRTYTDYLDDVSKTYVDPSTFNSAISANLADRSPEVGEPNNKINSQRGNSRNDDWYSFFGVMVMFKIHDPKAECSAFNKENKYKRYIRILNLKKLNFFNLF